uniref:Uncharacterized protein n=1 Tax=Biomphalaria glabrata TaxID=6526 RepID=A0A2C9L638_BIOGL
MKSPNYVVIYVISVLLVLVFIALSNYKIEMVRPRSATAETIKTRQVSKDVTDLSQADLIKNLTDLLLFRLNQPNNAAKILYTESCDIVASKSELACTNYSCPRGINPDPEARVKNMVMSPKLSLSPEQRDVILTMGKTIPENDVIILSASSANHYAEMQAMFQNLHTVIYPNIMANFTMVLFDIGLTKEQRLKTESKCMPGFPRAS